MSDEQRRTCWFPGIERTIFAPDGERVVIDLGRALDDDEPDDVDDPEYRYQAFVALYDVDRGIEIERRYQPHLHWFAIFAKLDAVDALNKCNRSPVPRRDEDNG
jgi:hypothetical protein